MSRTHHSFALALGLTLTLAGAAGAQAQKECEVNESRPAVLGRATLAVQMASSSQDAAVVTRQLTSAVKNLTDNNAMKMDNQVGRNLILGRALVLWSMQPNVGLNAKRGALGFATTPEADIDLAVAIDSAFKVVEAAHPECAVETARWRGQKPWVDLVNQAIERLNANQVDDAEAAARRALMLNPYSPYGLVVLANVLQKRNQSSEALKLYRQAVEVAAKDTTYDDIRRQSLVYMGNLAVDSAEMAPDSTAKKPYLAVARGAFEQLLADQQAGDFRSNARAGLCRVAIASRDTASLRENYKDALNNPGAATYSEVMNAGVCLARAEMVPEATKLFQSAYDKNPWHRDALSNLAIMHLRVDAPDQALPLAARLVTVEPNNSESIQLLMLSYAGIAKRARDARLAGTARPTETKTATKTAAARPAAPRMSAAAADSLFRIEKAYTDSAVATNERKEKLAFSVVLSDFTTTAEKATVAGTVSNLTQAAKDITVKVEFLDAAGNVVKTGEHAVGSVPAGDGTRFSVTATPGTGIAAFRYAEIQ